MKRIILKWLLVMAIGFQMIFGSAVATFADDDDNTKPPEVYVGAPEVIMTNGPVFDVIPGEVNEIEIILKNVSSYSAKSLTIKPEITDLTSNPFKITFENDSNKISMIAPRGETTTKLTLDVDETAATKTYAVTLNYTYFNTRSEKTQSKDTIYFKVKNPSSAPNFSIENFKITPESISVGSNASIQATLRNLGPLDMHEVEIALEGLDATKISVNGVNNKRYGKIAAGTQQAFTFNILTDGGIASGNYPLSYKIKYKDNNGKEYEWEQKFFINVGGTTSNAKPSLEIRNMAEPKGVYEVNENFSVKFDLINTGDNIAKNVKITATPAGTDSGVVPKSSSIQTLKDLEPGKSKNFSFLFAGTSASKSQNYAIEFLVEYEDGTKKEGVNNVVTFKQYAGANVSNPEGDKKDDDDKKTSKPKIIVSNYVCDPLIVAAGGEFDLTMTFLNTHATKTAKNIKMFLTLSEEKASDTEKTGNIFTPVDSSNTFYFDSIPSKGTVQKKLRLFTVPDAQPKTYTLTVNFEYEDAEGNEFTATELLGINVEQPTKIETGDIFIPEMAEVGMPISVSFDIFNTGKVTVNNLMIKVEGDVDTQNKSTYLGNMESGNSQYFDGVFTPMAEGETNVKIIISYDTPSGEHVENPHEFTLMVNPPAPMENMDDMNGMDDKGNKLSTKTIVGIVAGIVIVIIIIIVIVVVLKRKKMKKEAAFLEADDDVDEKGNDANEQL